MGTTTEKLSYLNETKTQIKNALETPYNVFRDYPAMIKKYIDNQPTKIATNGICDNAVELPIVSLKLDGNSEQKTTEGYNLLQNIDHKDDKSYTVNGVTFTKNSDGSIVANGNATETARYYLVGEGSQQRVEIKIGTYRVTGCPSGGSLSTYSMAWGITGLGEKYDLGDGINITLSSDTTYYFVVKIGKGQTVNNLVFKPMIISGTAEKSYEPYTGGTPSPNPDYPQDIEVIDGCNLFEINQEHSEFSELVYIYKYYLKPNTNYTVSTNVPKTNIASLYFNGTSSNTNGVYLNSSKTFTSDDKGYLFILIRFAQETDSINLYQKLLDGTYYIQFNEGSITKPYLPYGSIGLKQSGKNKFDNKVEAQLINNAKEITLDENKRITLTQATYSYAVFKIKQNISEYAGKAVRLKADFTKSNSNLNPKYGVLLGDANYSAGRQLMGESTVSGYTINFNLPSTFENGKEYLYVRLYATVDKEGNIDDYVDFNNIILTIDNEDMTYEPYHEPKTIPIDLNGNELAKVGDIKDKLIIHRNGEVEIEKRIGKINLKDVTLWYQDKELSNSNRFYTNEIIYANSNLTLSNYFKASNIQNINTVDEQGVCAVNNRQIALRINKTLVTNVDELKQWLLEHDVEVYYQLINAEIIKLPSIATIQLWQGTNIFKLITNLETDFEVEYVVDKDSMLDEVQTAMLNAEIEI